MNISILRASAIAVVSVLPLAVQAAPVDLSGWQAEGAGGNWTVAADKNSVFQSLNGDPTVFHNGTDSQGMKLSGTIRVETTGDDDYVGFVLGYKSGDLTGSGQNYILIDWKQLDQGGYYGGIAKAGLAISRVTGDLIEGPGAWLHDATAGVTELQRAATLGSTGWADNTTYAFDLIFRSNLIEVLVNGSKELSITGSFANGSFGFYNYSQASVRYAGIEEDVLPPEVSPVPVPAALPLLGAGLGALALLRRRNRRAA